MASLLSESDLRSSTGGNCALSAIVGLFASSLVAEASRYVVIVSDEGGVGLILSLKAIVDGAAISEVNGSLSTWGLPGVLD